MIDDCEFGKENQVLTFVFEIDSFPRKSQLISGISAVGNNN